MNEKKTRQRISRLEWSKNLLIIALICSALYLGYRSGISSYRLGEDGLLQRVAAAFDRSDEDPAQTPAQSDAFSAIQPSVIAVYNETGRYGVRYDTQQLDPLFETFSSLLQGAMASIQAPAETSEAAWRAALQSPGIYVELMCAVPLDALRTWSTSSTGGLPLSGSTGQLLLAQGDGDAVTLYYNSAIDGKYYTCMTDLSYTSHLANILRSYNGNSASFAFEYAAEEGYDVLDPYMLLGSAPLTPHRYTCAVPAILSDETSLSQLQRAIGFQPQASSVLEMAESTVVRNLEDTLRIDADGTIHFSAGEESRRYPVERDDYISLVEATYLLAQAALGEESGAARLYLSEITTREDGTVTVSFGYAIGGAAVHLTNGSTAAEFIVQNNAITEFTLRCRVYEDTGEETVVLWERQAAAAMGAMNLEGNTLVLCYEDTGSATTRVGWIAQSRLGGG